MSFFARLFGRSKKDEAGEELAATAESGGAVTAAGPPLPAATQPSPKTAPAAKAVPAAAKSDAKAATIPPSTSAPTKAPSQKGPLPPAPSNGGKPAGGGDVIEAVLGNLDASFNAIFDEKSGGSEGQGRTEESDKMAMLELFYEIAANHLKPVRNFMTELSMGDARREWVAIARPAVESILSAAQQIGIPELEKRLSSFNEVFAQVDGSTAFMISGELRQAFLGQYHRLTGYLPKAFALDSARDRNESLLTHSLLLQIPDVRKVTIDKLYRAGLSAMEVLFLATREDLAATTGVRSVLAERIVEKFQSYRNTSQGPKKDQASKAGELGKLASLLGELKKQHHAYEHAPANFTDAQKRGLRLSRQATVLDITVVLAELGEAEVVVSLEKLTFEQKIQKLEAYLKQHSM